MTRPSSLATSTLVFVACTLFLWMFFAAATLEHTAELGWIYAAPGQDARSAALEFAARWRHGMAANSPVYMPGFFAVAIAVWFWCAHKSLLRMVAEGLVVLLVASVCAALLAPFAAPRIAAGFVAHNAFGVSQSAVAGTWISTAQGVYSLLTWSTLFIAARWSLKLRSLKPLLVPLLLNIILALVRPWTVADFTSLWARQVLEGEPVAVISFLLIPMIAGFIAWVELRSKRSKVEMQVRTNTECQADSRG